MRRKEEERCLFQRGIGWAEGAVAANAAGRGLIGIGDDLRGGEGLGERVTGQQVGRGVRMGKRERLRVLHIAVAEDGDAGLGAGGFICSGRCTCWQPLKMPCHSSEQPP